ncbi:CsbD family protein [Methylopila musalis]|uniref:CsbD family protein n=1 Tax=Methylopila musalis TaxID=1134781 RepID=A0ABW3Z9R7_9HYPH
MVDSNTVKGAIKETVGKGKEAVGKATGNHSLEADGKVDQVEGKAQKAVGKATDATKSALRH